MASTLITGIGLLSTQTEQGALHNAALVIDDDRIAWIGSSGSAPSADARVDVDGRAVIPGFVDSHAHLVFAGDRSAEFTARMSGTAYSAGGIRSTVAATRAADDEALRANVARLTTELISSGSTTFEIKSGYGLTTEDESRSLRIAREFTPETTFLGAHVVAPEFVDDPAGYVSLVPRDGSTCSAIAGPSTATRRAPSSPPEAGPGSHPAFTPTSSSMGPGCRSPWRWSRLRRPLHPPRR